jgi:hypothetical protein
MWDKANPEVRLDCGGSCVGMTSSIVQIGSEFAISARQIGQLCPSGFSNGGRQRILRVRTLLCIAALIHASLDRNLWAFVFCAPTPKDIVQTRSAFNADLELDNAASSAMTNLTLALSFFDANHNDITAQNIFAVGAVRLKAQLLLPFAQISLQPDGSRLVTSHRCRAWPPCRASVLC